MNDQRLDNLFALGRDRRADTSRAEYGFETRLMSRLLSEQTQDTISIWAMVSWRLMPVFLVCMLGVAICSWKVGAYLDDAVAFTSIEHPETAEVYLN